MVFNILARNQDDHVKNIAFLMDKKGIWSLAPAFDMTYSYNPAGAWTSTHQMTLNGKKDGFTMEDFKACAETVSLKRGRAESIINDVRKAVVKWSEFAAKASVADIWRKEIKKNLRLKLASI
jgi:serine/threonine-protein kinase HipA